jgi:single-strand DNA-binding protein
MSNDLNRWEGIGRVGKIETRFTPQGQGITNISVACNESWRDKSGQKQEKCNWVPVVIFGKLSEIAEKWVNKGDMIYLSGKFVTRKWQDKQGADRYSTEIVVDGFNGVMQMLGGKSSESGQSSNTQQNRPTKQPNQQQYDNPQTGFDNQFEDDMPF